MDLGFSGTVTDFYHRYRRGYPPAVVDTLARTLGLTANDTTADLGCGTGQLTLPIARRVRSVLGIDPEPDMLAHARNAAAEQGVTNVDWIVGADRDLPALLRDRPALGAVTIAQALHWMDPGRLLPELRPFLRAGGGIAAVTNGEPLWLQDNAWSRALRGVLESWLDTTLTNGCGTDAASQQHYRDLLTAAGFEVTPATVEYTGELGIEQLIGGVYSAFSATQLPSPEERPRFAERVRDALAPHAPFAEHVRVTMLIGRTHGSRPCTIDG
ncbi:class I SAM-dependent methyltransferase [Qaidamihabitans albus]|uniref:class I SAM-dependent methyltransferase n=1 Tax=Qaidamihabitans albus TaxID=2795733 RepID=UPI0018F20DAA|nr:class I SAM-dependent methyltransferase [Qaidamihabitans albus]